MSCQVQSTDDPQAVDTDSNCLMGFGSSGTSQHMTSRFFHCWHAKGVTLFEAGPKSRGSK